MNHSCRYNIQIVPWMGLGEFTFPTSSVGPWGSDRWLTFCQDPFFATTHRRISCFFDRKMPEKISETCERPGAALAPWRIWGIFLPQILVAEKISPKTATWIMSKKPAILNLEFLFIFRLQPLVFWVPFWASRTWKTYTYTTDKWWIPLLYFTHLCFHLDQKYVDNAWIILCVGGQDMSRSTNG